MPMKKFLPKHRNLAFKLWRQNSRNLKKTAEQLREEYGIEIQITTIMRWRDKFDWEAKYLLVENQVKKLLRSSDDPILREMAMDDSLVMRFLGILTKLIEDSLGPHRMRRNFMPRNTRELMQMISFITEQQARILGAEAERRDREPAASLTFNDNRKIIMRDRLAAIPINQRRMVMDQIRGAVNQKALKGVREQVWDQDAAAANE
jgi:hypothetical protein